MESIIRGLIGILALLLICYLFSSQKKQINWKIVFKGLFIQLAFAICILKIKIIENLFQWVSNIFLSILDFTKEGSMFLFGETLVKCTRNSHPYAQECLEIDSEACAKPPPKWVPNH